MFRNYLDVFGCDSSIDIDECASIPCVHGQCNNDVDRFTCDCVAGWAGLLCDLGKCYL